MRKKSYGEYIICVIITLLILASCSATKKVVAEQNKINAKSIDTSFGYWTKESFCNENWTITIREFDIGADGKQGAVIKETTAMVAKKDTFVISNIEERETVSVTETENSTECHTKDNDWKNNVVKVGAVIALVLILSFVIRWRW